MTRKRRGSGEGAISLRSDGRWVARIDLGYVNGKRKVKSIYGKTRKEVSEKLRSYQQQRDQGMNIAVERQTVAQFLERWLSDVVAPTVRPSTHARYTLGVRSHIVPYIGRLQLTKLTPQDVQHMLQALAKQGKKPATVHNAYRVLRAALNVARRWQLVPRNVATLVDPPRIEEYQPRVLTPEQALHLLSIRPA